MPFYEYRCSSCGVEIEKFFKSISEGEKHDIGGCPLCGGIFARIISRPLRPHLYGNPDGYHNPSPTKRASTKVASETDGNKYTDG